MVRNELEDIELMKQIEAGEIDLEGDDEEMEVDQEEEMYEEGDDDEPFDADEYGESINHGPWVKPRSYTLLVGSLEVGPTLVVAESSQGLETENWNGRNWNMRKLATFGDHLGEKGLVFDAYLYEDRIIGASVSLTASNGIPTAKVCMWESR